MTNSSIPEGVSLSAARNPYTQENGKSQSNRA
ncbi:unnamed protein product [Rodentolepis nana]|uniref:Uncharacterized protein n=1 Tax=Rodentolepis nana TaxID=102285 RepID=A0A3P7VD35_RODNA|nr:unnamed protein product [Rodentolepis nana]